MAAPGNDVIWDRWNEVDRLFGQALDLAQGERASFLLEACAGDGILLDTLTRLLDSSDRAVEELPGPGAGLVQAAFTPHPTVALSHRPQAGDVVGRYRLVRKIGRGGMATVFEAERADGVLGRPVAVKLLKGVDSDELAQRFVVERQILSSLVHPNIARLLDGGAAEDGRPYFVMELVRGEPLTEWADRRKLGIPDRLRLFGQVLEAVQYAHTRLVVHRDLKPSNVMVDEDGRVRLLDFGIAKLLDDAMDPEPQTRTGTRWMTPEYAAPEQILTLPVTTATDVHALGVLLYELLTGRRPFQGGEKGPFQLEKAICEDNPVVPSSAVAGPAGSRSEGDGVEAEGWSSEAIARARATTSSRLRRALAGDLDAVVSKALRKRPEDRYRSAQELADDLARFLKGFPVRAREGLRTYRARKFVKRHWLAVGMSTALLVLLAGSAMILARLQAETAEQRDRATAAAARAETEAENSSMVIGFLANVFRAGNPALGPNDTLTARELVAWGAGRVDKEFARRPAVQANLLLVLGEAYKNLGLAEDGAALMERALELRRRIYGPDSEEAADALSHLATLHRTDREIDLAIPLYEQALTIRLGLPEHDDREIGATLAGLGLALADKNRPDTAEVLLRNAVRLLSPFPDDPVSVSTSLGLARVLRSAGKLDEAEALYKAGIPRYRALPEHDDTELAAHLNNLAFLLRTRGDYSGAEPLYQEALDLCAGLLGRGHPSTLLVAANLAGVQFLMGRQEDGIEVLRQSLEAAEATWPEGGWRVTAQRRSLGDALLRAGRIEEAEPVLRAAAMEFQEELGPQHDWTSFAFARVAVIQRLRGDSEASQAFMDRLYGWLVRQREDAGGTLPPGAVNQVDGLLYVLDAVGLEDEYRRFSGLVPESPIAEGGSS